MKNTLVPPENATLRLGFYLVRTGVTCAGWPEVSYRGVDRLPYLPLPKELEQLHESGKHRLAETWDSYWEAKDSGLLQRDVELAKKLQSQFAEQGHELEIVYAELTEAPRHLDRYPSSRLWKAELDNALNYFRSMGVLRRPIALLDFFGFDLSTLHASFHSAIFQPGFHEVCPTLPSLLNQNGLLENADDARHLLHRANEMDYGPLPFCIIAVWGTY